MAASMIASGRGPVRRRTGFRIPQDIADGRPIIWGEMHVLTAGVPSAEYGVHLRPEPLPQLLRQRVESPRVDQETAWIPQQPLLKVE